MPPLSYLGNGLSIPQTTSYVTQPVEPIDYYIFVDKDDSNKYKAKNCRTGAIDYVDDTGLNAQIVINGAIDELSENSVMGTSGPNFNWWSGGRYGMIYVGPGVFWISNSIILKSNIHVFGSGKFATIFKLVANHANNANSTMFKSSTWDTNAFAGLTGSAAQAGDREVRLEYFTIHGNLTNQSLIPLSSTATSSISGNIESATTSNWAHGIAFYGSSFHLNDLQVNWCKGAGIVYTGTSGVSIGDSSNLWPGNNVCWWSNLYTDYNGQQGILIRGNAVYLNNYMSGYNGEAGLDIQSCQHFASSMGYVTNALGFLDGYNHRDEDHNTYNPSAYEWRITSGHWFIDNCWVEGPCGPGDAILLGISSSLDNPTDFLHGYQLYNQATYVFIKNTIIDNSKYAAIRGSRYATHCNIQVSINPYIETAWASSGNNPTQQCIIWEGGGGNFVDATVWVLPNPPDTNTHHCALILGTPTITANNNEFRIHAQSCQYLLKWQNAGQYGNLIKFDIIPTTGGADAPTVAFLDPDGTTIDYTKNTIIADTVATARSGVSGLMSHNGGLAQFTGNGSTKEFDITHGLYITPVVENVNAASDEAMGNFRVDKDGTYVKVIYGIAPKSGAANNVKLQWYASTSP